jgi:hypothetical protein
LNSRPCPCQAKSSVTWAMPPASILCTSNCLPSCVPGLIWSYCSYYSHIWVFSSNSVDT